MCFFVLCCYTDVQEEGESDLTFDSRALKVFHLVMSVLVILSFVILTFGYFYVLPSLCSILMS